MGPDNFNKTLSTFVSLHRDRPSRDPIPDALNPFQFRNLVQRFSTVSFTARSLATHRVSIRSTHSALHARILQLVCCLARDPLPRPVSTIVHAWTFALGRHLDRTDLTNLSTCGIHHAQHLDSDRPRTGSTSTARRPPSSPQEGSGTGKARGHRSHGRVRGRGGPAPPPAAAPRRPLPAAPRRPWLGRPSGHARGGAFLLAHPQWTSAPAAPSAS